MRKTSTLPASPEEVFAWHAREGALERLTPPWVRMEVLDRTGGVEDGTRVTLRIKMGPVSFRWIAEHRDTVPGAQFVDEQIEGPFAHWIHTHRFDPDPVGSRLTDHIEYAPPFGAVGVALGDLCLPRDIERMLRYRHDTLEADLRSHRHVETPPWRVAVTGSRGLIGSQLVPFLTTGGHDVVRVVRSSPQPTEVGWRPESGEIDRDGLAGIDAVIHLAGESIAARRWDAEHKARVRQSRVVGTRVLSEAIASLDRPPRVLITASAVGFYGSRGEEELTESSPPGDGFLAEVGRAWEEATAPAHDAGVRVAMLRFGVVLSPRGGALATMLPAFRAGLGGRLGSGAQWMSWISIDDAVGAIHHVLMTDDVRGPVNVVAPGTVTNRRFTEVLGGVLGRPTVLPVPAGVLRLVVGDLADEALLASTRVVPGVLTGSGYRFRHPDLGEALPHVLGRWPRTPPSAGSPPRA